MVHLGRYYVRIYFPCVFPPHSSIHSCIRWFIHSNPPHPQWSKKPNHFSLHSSSSASSYSWMCCVQWCAVHGKEVFVVSLLLLNSLLSLIPDGGRLELKENELTLREQFISVWILKKEEGGIMYTQMNTQLLILIVWYLLLVSTTKSY